jgi:hypothetical protein
MTAPHRLIQETRGGQKGGPHTRERANHYLFAVHDLLAQEARSWCPRAGGSGPAPMTMREQIRRTHRWPALVRAAW